MIRLCCAGLLMMAIAVPAAAQTAEGASASEPACTAPEAREFDFWLGEWEIAQRILRADGTYASFPARTEVVLAAAGCALVEHWRGTVDFFWAAMPGPAELRGLSVRAWDPRQRQWVIHWLDNLQPALGDPFTGAFENGRGVFTQRSTEEDAGEQVRRITFARRADGGVDWTLDLTRDGGSSWRTIWSMRMTRRGASTDVAGAR